MKGLSIVAFVCLSILSLTPAQAKKDVTIVCKVSNCIGADSLYMFEFNGVGFEKIRAAKIINDSSAFQLPTTAEPRFFYIGLAPNNVKPIIVGTEERLVLISDCSGFRNAQVSNSALNTSYEAIKVKLTAFANETNALSRDFQLNQGDEVARKSFEEKLAALDSKKLDYLSSIETQSHFLANIVELNTYLNFAKSGAKYPNDLEYFAKEYFQLVDWNDSGLNYTPWVYESTKYYTSTLSSINLDQPTHKKYLYELLAKIPVKSRTGQLALGGMLAGMQERNHPNYVAFAKIFVDRYKATQPEACVSVEQQLKRLSSMIPGSEAPDFTQMTPADTPLSLSNLRGKVVLVDFWASWCGPCRRENPSVVRLYQKYKDKGFDILGVSLDRTKENWVNAIEADSLPWHHISDLKGWGNEVAKMYSVSSIPHTMLVDREGKIIARGLRGETLEAKLHEIFGE
jgi:thiol-disulfide isomerase/thioredoxin